jgi:hypothetical protein
MSFGDFGVLDVLGVLERNLKTLVVILVDFG